jgi:hypothetical protein
MRARAIAGALLLLAAAGAAAQSPSADWRTVETGHFRIHYPAPFELWARRVAARIEPLHARVAEFVGESSRAPIDVVIEDPEAAARGVAFPFLNRRVIVLWTAAPEPEPSFGRPDWPDSALTHEMARIVHLAPPRKQSRSLFSRFSLPPFERALHRTPRWWTRGYATLLEDALTGPARRHSDFRAMVIRQLAIEGAIPAYRDLSSLSGWLRGTAPDLVGATFLEWLEARQGSGSLRRLWVRLTSGGGGFEKAFREVFGKSAKDLYDQFRAETTARGVEEGKRLGQPRIARGELWQRLEGATTSPQVSPDGRYLLARRETHRGEAEIAVWEIGSTPAEPGKARAPFRALPAINGYPTGQPRWMPDGKTVLFSRKSPDSERMLRSDLYLWNVLRGSIRRVTRGADVAMADPFPDGRSLIGVSNRHGLSRLVRVDVESGRTEPFRPDVERDDPWRIWIHPRVSPDGGRVAVLVNSNAKWRPAVFDIQRESFRELSISGSPVGPPAWSPDGARLYVANDSAGVWNLEAISVDGGGARAVTRVTGAAVAPAPVPDGRALFYLDLSSHGFDLRFLRLDPGETAGGPAPPDTAGSLPILPPPAVAAAPAPEPPVPASHEYRVGKNHAVRLYLGESLGPSGAMWQPGLEGSDLIGRFHWLAVASLGSVSGPRGAALSIAWRGWPVVLRGQLFDAVERPGAQQVLRRPEFDQSRLGAFADAVWGRPIDGGSVQVSGSVGSSRVEALAMKETFRRDLAAVHAEWSVERSRGRLGAVLEGDVSASAGRTDGESWAQTQAGGRVTVRAWKLGLRVAGRLGETSGTPTRFDLFSVGGAPSSLFPEALDRNRLTVAALPADVQVGRRIEEWRADLMPREFPMSLFYERARAWTPGLEKPEPVILYGAEMRFDDSRASGIAIGSFDFFAGIARIRSRTPAFASTRLYAGIVYRP